MPETITDVLNQALPTPLHVCTDDDLRAFVERLEPQDIGSILSDVIRCHEQREHLAPEGAAVIDSYIRPLSEDAVKNMLMYSEAVVVPDPLMHHPYALEEVAPGSWSLSRQMPLPSKVQKNAFLSALRFHRIFRDAISSGLVVPSSHSALVAAQQINDDHFFGKDASSAYPPPIALSDEAARVLSSRARIHSAQFDNDGVSFTPGTNPRESSAIAIRFDGDPGTAEIAVERHMTIVSHARDSSGGLRVRLVEGPCTDDESYESWVFSSLLKRGTHRVTSLQCDLAFAQCMDGSVLTPSTVNWELLRTLVPSRNFTPEDAFLSIEIPHLANVTIGDVVRARQDVDLFEQFRRGFRKAFADYRSSPEVTVSSREFKEHCEDYINSGIREISQNYRALRVKSASALALSTVTIVAAAALAPLGGLAWALSIAGSLGELATIGSHLSRLEEMKSHPMFMMWSMTRAPFQASPNRKVS